jgi:protein-tyrosine phosphatase
MAAALLERQCARRGLVVDVRSAGTHAGIAAVEATMLDAMARRDIDLSAHRPRLLDREMLASDGADLILAMAREHLRAVAIMAPGAITRTFTAKELARRVDGMGLGDDPAPSPASWRARVAEGRSIRELMGSNPTDDIADPYSTSLANHVRTADEIDALMSTVAGSLSMWLG